MEGWRFVPVLGGVILVSMVALDVFLTTLHADVEGPIAMRVQHGVWRTMVAVGRRWARFRRRLLALAGPTMAATTFALWLGLFILGFALMVWPYLGDYRSEPAMTSAAFVDAIYYAGSTITVLGLGDISPLSGTFKVLTVVVAASGFALLTSIVAYIVEIVGSIAERNRFVLRLHDESGGGRSGTDMVIRSLESEDVGDLRTRLDEWSELVRNFQDKLQRFAAVSFYYRARDPVHDPEPAIEVAAEAAIAGHLVAHGQLSRLRPAVEHLDATVDRLQKRIAAQYLPRGVPAILETVQPEGVDREAVEAMAGRLRSAVAEPYGVEPRATERSLVVTARTRVFMSALRRTIA